MSVIYHSDSFLHFVSSSHFPIIRHQRDAMLAAVLEKAGYATAAIGKIADGKVL